MRIPLLLVVCALVPGCSGLWEKSKVEAPPPPVMADDCYTVDLFTEVVIERPGADVPDGYRSFLGEWGGGAWNEVWCHGLLINKVEKSGRVELVEMHAPYEPWNQPATAFRRVGHIDGTGNLRFAYGVETVAYRLENGKLIGDRRGVLGRLHVELARTDVPATQALAPVPIQGPARVPVPVPNPVRLAQFAGAAPGG